MLFNLDSLNPVSLWEYFTLFVIGLVCFLIGWFFSRKQAMDKYGSALKRCHHEKNELYHYAQDLLEDTHHADKRSHPVFDVNDYLGVENKKINLSRLNYERFGRADASQKDNLKRIKGIGFYIESRLNDLHIYSFDQISRFELDDIELITELIQFFPGRIERDDWVGQAKMLKQGKSTEFSDRVDKGDVDYHDNSNLT